MGLVSDVDLDIKAGSPARFFHGVFDAGGQLWAVERLNHVEKCYGEFGLVPLKVADKVKLEFGVFLTQKLVFVFCLFNAVFAENGLSGVEGFFNRLRGLGFAYGNQFDAFGRAPGGGCGGGDFGPERGEIGGDLAHVHYLTIAVWLTIMAHLKI